MNQYKIRKARLSNSLIQRDEFTIVGLFYQQYCNHLAEKCFTLLYTVCTLLVPGRERKALSSHKVAFAMRYATLCCIVKAL